MTLVLLLKLIDFMVNLIERTYLIERQTHNSALLGNGLQNALANPPYGIGNKLESTSFIKFLCSLYQSDISFVNQIRQSKSLMLVLLGHRYHEAQVGRDKLVFGTLTLWTTFTNLLGQFNLLINGDKRGTSNLDKIFIQCFT